MADSFQPYRVLARKYRPQSFGELIGQDAMVRTLANAIKRDRLAHAFVLTGVRGVGKTSTARLIAKALNCVGPDGQGQPTIDPCGQCEPCKAIAEGRHIDVVEMDAASHTGIEDVREIIEAVRYASVSARYKIYIIDEVHMLSRQAFNGLLKTLEEPPPHVKFLFATTEVNKIPVTILSRCQRFDLRRIPGEALQAHFGEVAKAEGFAAEPEALALIAAAAEGSARDGLSILDQAIAHAEMAEAGGEGATLITAAQVREMLGLADRGLVRRLFGHVIGGETAALLDLLEEQHRLGVDPLAIMADLLAIVHAITLLKAGRQDDDPARSAEEREAIGGWAEALGFGDLHRMWQLLLKGHGEVQAAVHPRDACDMALLRVIHAASMPDPSELARLIAAGGAGAPPPRSEAPKPVEEPGLPGLSAASAQQAYPPAFPALVDHLDRSGQAGVALELHDCFGLVRYEPPLLVLKPLGPARIGADAVARALGKPWTVQFSDEPAAPSLREQEQARETAARDAILSAPAVSAVMTAFPDAELTGVETIAYGSANA